jgi:hypothetical protein
LITFGPLNWRVFCAGFLCYRRRLPAARRPGLYQIKAKDQGLPDDVGLSRISGAWARRKAGGISAVDKAAQERVIERG